MNKHLTDEAANDIRLFANDAISQLQRHRKRGQLSILKIQLDRAIAELDAVDSKRTMLSQATHRRTKIELVWRERIANQMGRTTKL